MVLLGLESLLERRPDALSGGEARRVAIGRALLTRPRLLILDEPTANLDPTARSVVLDLVREARAAGKTVIFSSHVLSEVEETCGHVVIMRAGRVVHEQSIEALRRGHRIRAHLQGRFPGVPVEFAGRLTATMVGVDRVVMETDEPLAPLLGWLSTLPLAEVRVEPVGLQAVYDRFHHAT